jgi:hypothetical protein
MIYSYQIIDIKRRLLRGEKVFIKILSGRNRHCIGQVIEAKDGYDLTYKIDTNRATLINWRDCELVEGVTTTYRHIKEELPDLESVIDALGFEVRAGDAVMVSTTGCVAKIGKVKRIGSDGTLYCRAIDLNNDFKVPKVWQESNLNFIKLTKDLLDRLMLIKLSR